MATGYEASASAIYWVGGGHEAEAKTKAVQHMDRAVEVGGCMHVVQSACSYTLTQCSYTLTQCSYTLTQCSYTLTQCSYTLTQCSYTLTQCSYTLTQCSYTAGAHQRPCFLRSSWLAVGRSEHYIRAQRC
jgi:hypothetical protein